MGYFSGVNGSMLVDGKVAARVTSWTLSSSMATLSVSSLGDTDSVMTQGLRSTSGTCTVFYHQDISGDNTGNAASELFQRVSKPRFGDSEPGQAARAEKATFKLVVNDGTVSGKYLVVEAHITSAATGIAVGAVVQADVSFTCIGAPKEVEI